MARTKSAPKVKMPSQRQLRAGEIIRHALSSILSKHSYQDPVLLNTMISVCEVRPTTDLRAARVFVTPMGNGDAIVLAKALNRCAPHLRGCLGQEIDMKFTPELKFFADTSFDAASKIEELLNHPNVARDLVGKRTEKFKNRKV